MTWWRCGCQSTGCGCGSVTGTRTRDAGRQGPSQNAPVLQGLQLLLLHCILHGLLDGLQLRWRQQAACDREAAPLKGEQRVCRQARCLWCCCWRWLWCGAAPAATAAAADAASAASAAPGSRVSHVSAAASGVGAGAAGATLVLCGHCEPGAVA